MRTKIINGRAMARACLSRVIQRLTVFQNSRQEPKDLHTSSTLPRPGLAIVQIGARADAVSFTSQKEIAARKCQFHYEMHQCPRDVSQKALARTIDALNNNPAVNGIVVQLPMPGHLPPASILSQIQLEKDVDALHPSHVGALWMGPQPPLYQPCTAVAVERLLDTTEHFQEGQHAVVVGAGPITGCPIARCLLRRHLTVTVCNEKTRNIKDVCRNADILLAATGRPHIVDGSWVKEGAVVIDVGITKTPDGIRGDVDLESVRGRASHVTPVPGGVGPMTVAVLMENTLESFLRAQKVYAVS